MLRFYGYKNELERFKICRDKAVAHSEFGYSTTDLPSYDVMERLFIFGADFYELVAVAFVSIKSASLVPCDLNRNRKVKNGFSNILSKLGLTDIKKDLE